MEDNLYYNKKKLFSNIFKRLKIWQICWIIVFIFTVVICVHHYTYKYSFPETWNGVMMPTQKDGMYDSYSTNQITLPLVGWTDNKFREGHIGGSFFLGCGTISGDSKDKLVYLVMVQFPNGVIKNLQFENVNIILKDDVAPSIRLYDGYLASLALKEDGYVDAYRYEKKWQKIPMTIVVPTGSIQYNNLFTGGRDEIL